MLKADERFSRFNRRRIVFRAVAFGGAVLASGAAMAQSDFPNKPIHFIVGFSAGGPSDIISRVIGAKMGDALGQQVVVENRTGAGGTIATDYVARSDPDGYTMLNTTTANPSNETLSKTLQARFGKDLVAVATLADTANILVVHPSLGVKNMADFIALAKKQKDLLYATAGIGSSTHLTSELFNTMAGVKINPVHYRGGGAALKDLLSGQVKIMFSSIAPVIGFVQEGKLIGIATTGAKRDPAFPNLPTVAEAGLPGFETRLWIGITVRAGTPKPIIDKLAAAATKAAQDPEVKAALAKQGFQPLIMNPAQFDAYYRSERDKWGKVIKDTGMDKN
jgi:tripartite-type tricarboxylate transporter receptor subunit TctC